MTTLQDTAAGVAQDILVERRDAAQVIRLNRPQKKNAISRAMYRTMTAALHAGDADPEVRLHVVLGTPGAFSAGNDLGDFLAAATDGGAIGSEAFAFLEALAGVEKPIVSGVDGIAVGIGTTINLHCDLTFATPRSAFRTPFVDLGLVPEAGSSLLVPALIGRQRAFALLILGETLSAEAAKDLGLIYQVVAENALEQAVFAAAAATAAKPPQAMRVARDLMLGPRAVLVARIREEAERFGERLASTEARAALQAFLERKKAG